MASTAMQDVADAQETDVSATLSTGLGADQVPPLLMIALPEHAGTFDAPTAVSTAPLSAISCATTTFCVAVDDAGRSFVFSGTWSKATPHGTSVLSAVACPTTTFCVTGGGTGAVYVYDGTTWSTRGGVLAGPITALSCASPSSCVALSSTAQAAVLAGATWSRSTVAVGDAFVAASCTPGGGCTAITFGAQAFVHTSAWANVGISDGRPAPLTGVSCGTTAFCAAVDNAGRVATFGGSSWTALTPTGLPTLSAVSCAGAFCMAVSGTGAALAYKAGSWGHPKQVDSAALTAVSCVSVKFCAATDASNHVVTFNGTGWIKPSSEGIKIGKVRGFTGVSCASATLCVAIDTYGNELVFGHGPAVLHLADARYTPLTGVSCGSPTLCVAVDEEGRAILMHIAGAAKSWSPPVKIDPYRLTAVSCTIAGFCLATDDAGGTVALASGAWATPSRTIPLNAIDAVSCAGRGTCVAVGRNNAATGVAPV